MKRFIIPALLAAAIPATAVWAQSQTPAPAQHGPRLSSEALTRLQDGRMAMIKESLKLDDAQLKLWAPVEAHMRATFAARQQARAERRERRQQGIKAERPTLPDRLDRASQRMAERADRMKAYAEAIRPFYASLTDDQKAVAGIVLRPGMGLGRGHGHRWAAHRARRGEQK
jgi:hypothetical protein